MFFHTGIKKAIDAESRKFFKRWTIRSSRVIILNEIDLTVF